jgi:thiamine pyrophosphate-dependent acetolactate synthase large subunit-like protein
VTLGEALAALVPHLTDEVCVHANGYISRAGHAARDRDTCFYMIGSMGLASSIGLGVALARPEQRVVVLDGDGNVLMNPGALASIGARGPANLLHLCFDNGAHASTGAQPTISDRVHLEELARATGYRWVGRVDTTAALADEAPRFLARQGPAFLLVRIVLGPAGPPGVRIPHSPEAMTVRLRRALGVDARA